MSLNFHHVHLTAICATGLQAVNLTGDATYLEATEIRLQLTVATTPAETTSLYVFLGGTAIDELNDQLKRMGKTMTTDPCSSQHVCMLSCLLSNTFAHTAWTGVKAARCSMQAATALIQQHSQHTVEYHEHNTNVQAMALHPAAAYAAQHTTGKDIVKGHPLLAVPDFVKH